MSLVELDMPIRKINRIRSMESVKLIRFPLRPRGHTRQGWRDPGGWRRNVIVNEKAVLESEG